METQRSLKEVFDEYRTLRGHDCSADRIGFLREQLNGQWPEDEARTLRGMLIGELQAIGHFREAQRLLGEDVARDPTEPFYSLSLAEHHHYYDIDLPKALAHIGLAIVKARTDGKFLYQSLGIQARLAIETECWPLLEATLREMTAYEHRAGDVDVFPETDFLARVPAEVIDPEMIAGFLARVEYLRSIGYSTLTGRSSGLPPASADL